VPDVLPPQMSPRVSDPSRRWWAWAPVVVALVAWVYRDAAALPFFNDDFHWLFDARRFSWAGLVDLARYDHFYRPVIALYFHFGQRVFGCDPAPFHVVSVGLHLLNAGLLALIAWRLTHCRWTTAAAVLLFSVQPAYVEAVVWVGAITDLLPATWVLLGMWLHLVWLQDGRRLARVASFVVFAVCLGTHESAVTLLPMMVALDLLHAWPTLPGLPGWVRMRWRTYAAFAAMLAAFLVVAWIVNSRSYLVRDGYYRPGWHMADNLFSYLAGMYVGRRRVAWHLGVAVVLALLAWRGTPRVRFLLVWIVVTLAPVLPFTWGTASRYGYVPAAGFALLLADRIVAGVGALQRAGTPRRVATVAGVAIVAALTIRFGWFARGGVNDFRRLAAPYERFAVAVQAADREAPGRIRLTPRDVAGIEQAFVDPAAETALCRADVHVAIQ